MEVIISKKRVLVDREDWNVYGKLKWYAGTYLYTQIERKTVYFHRAICGQPIGIEIDHINGNPLDNRRSNLRLCTRSQNEANKKAPSHNTSGYKGVSLYKPTGKFSAYIEVDQKKKHLGYYFTPEEAALAYNEAAILAFGEFAKINNLGAE